MVICLERGADLHMAQLMPLPLIVSCFAKIQIGFTFLVPAHPGSPGKRVVTRLCVLVAHITIRLHGMVYCVEIIVKIQPSTNMKLFLKLHYNLVFLSIST